MAIHSPREWLIYAELLSRFLLWNWAFRAVLLLGAGLLLCRLPRLAPAPRHALLVASLVLATLAPLAGFLPERWTVPTHAIVLRAAAARPRPASHGNAVSRRSAGQSLGANRSPLQPIADYWCLALLLAGLLVAAGRTLRVLASARVVAGWRRRARPVDRHRVYDACGYSMVPFAIYECPAVRVPVVAGVLHPVILVPEGLPERLSPAALRHVLEHEAGHVRRRDPLWFFLAELSLCVLFWNPLAELVRRKMVAAAEDACDEAAVRGQADGPAYVRTLLSVLEHATPSSQRAAVCPLGAEGSDLTRRAVRILSGIPQPCRPLAALAGLLSLGAAAGAVNLQLGQRPTAPRQAKARSLRVATVERVVFAPYRLREHLQLPARVHSIPPAVRTARVPPVSRSVGTDFGTTAPELLELERPAPAELAAVRDAAPPDGHCVVFVVDASVDMHSFRDEVRERVLGGIARLGPADHFNVVAYDRGVRTFAEYPVTPSEDSAAGVRAWLEAQSEQVAGSPEGAIEMALRMPGVSSILLLSDRNLGYAQRAGLASLVDQQNPCHAQVVAFTFGPSPFDPEGIPSIASPGKATRTNPSLEAGQGTGDLRP